MDVRTLILHFNISSEFGNLTISSLYIIWSISNFFNVSGNFLTGYFDIIVSIPLGISSSYGSFMLLKFIVLILFFWKIISNDSSFRIVCSK